MEYRYVLTLGLTEARIEVVYALGQLVFRYVGLFSLLSTDAHLRPCDDVTFND
jgi:hypothetical protein